MVKFFLANNLIAMKKSKWNEYRQDETGFFCGSGVHAQYQMDPIRLPEKKISWPIFST
jgi:hypothetical protein